MDPTERFYGSLVCVLALIFVTVIAAVLFMKGQSPGWGWVVIGSGLVGTYRVWVL